MSLENENDLDEVGWNLTSSFRLTKTDKWKTYWEFALYKPDDEENYLYQNSFFATDDTHAL